MKGAERKNRSIDGGQVMRATDSMGPSAGFKILSSVRSPWLGGTK